MTTMLAEVYDALRDAHGASEEKPRKAAEAIASYDNPFADLAARSDRIEGRINTLTWMVGTNITLTLLVLGRFFLLHSGGEAILWTDDR